MSFKILDHTADVGIEATGPTFDEALKEAARGFYSLALGDIVVIANQTKHVVVSAPDKERLVVKWLSELLYLFDSEHFIADTIVFQRCGHFEIEAEVSGKILNLDNLSVFREIKAVTYHQLSVKETSNNVSITVFFDI
jgi:SHS2 domain-containing protein